MASTTEFRPISSDAFKSWSRCRKQFYYKYVRRLSWPSDIQHFRLGRDVHKLLDYQARGLDCTLLLENAPDDVRFSMQKLMAHRTANLPVVANEWGFHIPVGGHWLTGRIDRVSRDGSKILVIDWKTGTGVPRNPHTDWQTILYLYALVETAKTASAADLGLQGLKPEDCTFVYVEVKPDETTPIVETVIRYDAEKHAGNGELIAQTVAAMADEEDYCLPGKCPDRFCMYRAICGIDEALTAP